MARRALLSSLMALLLMAGCVTTDESDFGWTLPDDTSDEGDGPADTLDDEDPSPITWDVAPPEHIEVGAILTWTIDCGMLNGAGGNAWEWTGDQWAAPNHYDGEELGDSDGGYPYDEVMPCFRPTSNPTMEWDEDGSIRFFNGDWLHDMAPSTSEGLWLGIVSPMFEVGEECYEGMAEVGIEMPVHLSIRMNDVIDPTS
jgi:hypothetical protein